MHRETNRPTTKLKNVGITLASEFVLYPNGAHPNIFIVISLKIELELDSLNFLFNVFWTFKEPRGTNWFPRLRNRFIWLTSESSHGGCESWSPTTSEFMWWTFFAQLLRKKGEFWPKVKMSMGVGAGQKCHSPLRSYKPDHQAFVTRARPYSSACKKNNAARV